LRDHAICAFITKDESLLPVMIGLGYEILGVAHVPQKDFALPSSKRGKNNNDQGGSSSNCIVTIVKYTRDKHSNE
jgi:hypothetical protein